MSKLNHPYAIFRTKTKNVQKQLGPNTPDTEHELYIKVQLMIQSLNIDPDKEQLVIMDLRIMNIDAEGILLDEDLYKDKDSEGSIKKP